MYYNFKRYKQNNHEVKKRHYNKQGNRHIYQIPYTMRGRQIFFFKKKKLWDYQREIIVHMARKAHE